MKLLPGDIKRENAIDERRFIMSQVHFQSELYSEIIKGLVESFKDFKVEAGQLIKAATEIYISSAPNEVENIAAGETDFNVELNRKSVICLGILECKSCGFRHGKFVGEQIRFCPGCGKAVKGR